MAMNPADLDVVFDLGGVLIDWNPEYLYSKLIPDASRRRFFLENVCSPSWNLEQDKGRSWRDAEEDVIARYPDWASEIRAYRARWHEMVAGPLDGGFELLSEVVRSARRVTALSNWNDETFGEVADRFPILRSFHGATISGRVGLVKPDHDIYALHETTFGLVPSRAIFIDDNLPNVVVARQRGWHAIHHANARQTRAELIAWGVLKSAQ